MQHTSVGRGGEGMQGCRRVSPSKSKGQEQGKSWMMVMDGEYNDQSPGSLMEGESEGAVREFPGGGEAGAILKVV